ncbi:ferritin [Blattabacterium cuenoti]|uniref:ferritin n=1 Tax=Blattabacterium cuenoti TaxID=1653831 RepID=UPI00163CF7C4|nr:ferritin [Blattabacterium cuenoti]
MIKHIIELELKKQFHKELESSLLYLSMASWVEHKYGEFDGISHFLYDHSQEENIHMIKLIKYINKRGGYADLNNINIHNNMNITSQCNSIQDVFKNLFKHEQIISQKVSDLVKLSLKEHDYFTYHFLQWYIQEQIEEENLIKKYLDKIKLIEEDKSGWYLFDKDITHNHNSK